MAYSNQGEGWVHKAMNPNSDNTSFDLMKACLYLEMAVHVFYSKENSACKTK